MNTVPKQIFLKLRVSGVNAGKTQPSNKKLAYLFKQQFSGFLISKRIFALHSPLGNGLYPVNDDNGTEKNRKREKKVSF